MRIHNVLPEEEGEVHRVYRLLKSWILEGRVRPGEFLSEVELARQCETSRTPVREACNLLSQEKWIQRIRHKGYVIPPISVPDIIEVYEYRKVLECFNAERTASDGTHEELQSLRDIVTVEDDPSADMIRFLETNQQFHLRLAEIARNQRIVEQLQLTLEYVKRLDILTSQKDTRPVSHREIMRAIEARNSRKAARAMAEHIHISRDQMLRVFGT
ncbi:MAG TPA: GntR family transcriptional regulator [Bryobacteraceae bacterium]|nr:GntR family transcriptional regulator [Bryobacteraceae bacterium]